jgi:hypothetical protein
MLDSADELTGAVEDLEETSAVVSAISDLANFSFRG